MPLDLELLVHGVGGATPQGMLNDPRVVRVTGDDTAAVYRRADEATAEDDPGRSPRGPVREAYCWSNLTSGDGRRALWLLLVPFMIVNLAHWMRPRHGGDRRNWWYDAVLRLLALTLTVLLVTGACEMTMDLVAWQCADSAYCAAGKHWLVLVNSAQHGWWSEPGRRLVLGAGVPLVLVAGLWWLSRRTWWAYEQIRPAGEGGGRGGPLARAGFWYGCCEVARLRAAHTAAGVAVVAAALWTPAFRQDLHGGTGTSALLRACGWTLAGALGALAVAVLTLTVCAWRDEDQNTIAPARARLDRGLCVTLQAGALTVLAAALVFTSWHRRGWDSGGHGGRLLLPTPTLCVLTLAQAVLIGALGVLTVGVRPRQGAMYGLAGPATALLACSVGALFTSGSVQRMADWLDRGGATGSAGDLIAGPPVLLTWQASVLPGGLLVLAVTVAGGAWLVWRGAGRLRGQVESDYPRPDGEPPLPYERNRTRHIARAQALAGLTDRGPVLLTTIVVAACVLGGGALAGAALTGRAPGAAAGHAAPWIQAVARGAQATGTWLLGAATLALIALGRRAYRNTTARRTVGILWDIGTFWPRAAHPFAPPCYAERAVPDLTWRMTTWTTAHPDNRIVLSGHSQGSVLAAAAAWQLPEPTRDRVALLTYGSPLARLYGRWFPAFFGPDRLALFHEDVHDWSNLWRRTDPIGGACLLPEVDRRLKDPLAYHRDGRHPLIAPVLGHSHYPEDPEFAVVRAGLLRRLRAQERGGERAAEPAHEPAHEPRHDEPGHDEPGHEPVRAAVADPPGRAAEAPRGSVP